MPTNLIMRRRSAASRACHFLPRPAAAALARARPSRSQHLQALPTLRGPGDLVYFLLFARRVVFVYDASNGSKHTGGFR